MLHSIVIPPMIKSMIQSNVVPPIKIRTIFFWMKVLKIFQGNYGEIYNFNQKAFESNMEEMDSDDDEDEEDEDSGEEREFVEDDSDIESENEIEDMEGYEKV